MLEPPYVKVRNPILYLREIQEIKEEQDGDDKSNEVDKDKPF
jgi:hypothetical protein